MTSLEPMAATSDPAEVASESAQRKRRALKHWQRVHIRKRIERLKDHSASHDISDVARATRGPNPHLPTTVLEIP